MGDAGSAGTVDALDYMGRGNKHVKPNNEQERMNNEEKKKDQNPHVTGKEPLTEAERITRKTLIV